MGAQVSLHLERWGWYPRGGGEARLTIAPVREFSGCQWLAPPAETAFQAVSAASGVAGHVSRRQAARLEERLGRRLPVQEVPAVSQEPGSFVFIWGPQAGFSALGAKGKPAQKVADEAITAYLNFRERRAALDAHLADQMALYLPQAKSPSAFSTEAITSHLLTNLGVIEQFTGPTFNVQGRLGDRGEIRCPGSRL
jgi:RNA 3'-terminal phosphate cyclase